MYHTLDPSYREVLSSDYLPFDTRPTAAFMMGRRQGSLSTFVEGGDAVG
jgi:hypothetical protein